MLAYGISVQLLLAILNLQGTACRESDRCAHRRSKSKYLLLYDLAFSDLSQ